MNYLSETSEVYEEIEREMKQELEQEIVELEARLADLEARLPAHSLPPSMIIEMDELEEQLADARRRYTNLDYSQ